MDILSLQGSLYLGYLLRCLLKPIWPLEIIPRGYHALAICMILAPFGYWLSGLYPGYGMTSVERLRRRVWATFVFLMLFFSWDFLANNAVSSRGIVLGTFVFALVIPPIAQTLFRSFLIRCNRWGTPVVVLGAARTGEHLVQSLQKDRAMGLRPVAVFDDDPAKAGKDLAGVPVFHGLLKANELSAEVRYALVAIPGAGRDVQLGLVGKLNFRHIIIVPDLIGLQSLWVEARDMGGIVGLEIQKNLLLLSNRFAKQFIDYFMGIPLFILSLPILLCSALYIMLTDPGPAFYCQVREGFRGKKFKVWKLRTMYSNAEKLLHEHLAAHPVAKREWDTYFKLKDDPRILKGVGSFLRKTSLDELPQLWNVLRGEMSLVGPRPFPHYHLERFNDDFRAMRRSVMPGMTGLWQVDARSDGDLLVQEKLDTYYIRNWSIWLDISLLGRTIIVVLSGKGAY